MNAMIKWFPYFALILSLIFIFIFFIEQRKFHQWIFTYWGKKPTRTRLIQLTFYCVAIILFLFSLADWRGDEKTLEGKKSSEKTILLIDNSLSMLVEDVRPNRFEKAVLMARHFLKASPGHEISVVLFSDTIRKYVPFTTDIDLLDARISGLKELNRNLGGSSNIKQALRESLDFINPNPLARKGNIVIFTDADGMDEDFPIDIGPSISVAIIAIATSSGGPIPVRDREGVLQGNKTYQGEQVISKLNQKFLDSLSSQIKNYKYWIATSFSLPTNEILDFLNNKGMENTNETQNMRSREVLYEYWLIPAVLIFLLSLILKRVKTWKFLSILIFIAYTLPGSYNDVFAQENKVKEILPLLEALKKNQLDEKGRLNTAQKILESGDPKKALQIYKETLDEKAITEDNKYSWINYAQILAANEKTFEAIKKMKQLQEYKDLNEKDSEFEKNYAESLLSLLEIQQGQQEKEEKKKEEEKKQDKQEDNKKDGEKENQENKDEQQKEDKKENKENSDQKNEEEKEEKKNNENKKENEPKKSRAERQKELSSLLKQLLNEDRNLQQKYIDTRTKESQDKKNPAGGAKDW